jgi:hypothetical protein
MLACVDGKGEKGTVGARQGAKMGQLTLSIGQARAEFRFLVQRASIPSKRVVFTFVNTTNMHFNIIYACYTLNLKIQNPLSSSLKINHVMENWNMHLFLAHWTERLQTLHTVSHEFSINISSIATWLCTVSPTSVSFFR